MSVNVNAEVNVKDKSRSSFSVRSALFSLLIKIGVIAGILVVLFFFILNFHTTSGDAMSPSFNDRDLVLSYRLDKSYAARDVVVLDVAGERQVRRVVAVEGDTVDVTSEGLRVNGYLQQEHYANGETLAFEGDVEYPVTLGAGEIFVLGDNREHSIDSRVYGPVKSKDTIGAVITVIRRTGF